MPTVPYTGIPDVSPRQQGAPEMRIATPEAAFGGATAAATQRLGGALEGAGNELFQRALAMQDLANSTEANEANVKFMIEAGKLHADYGALQGQDAVRAYPKFTQDLQDLQKRISASTSNPMSRRMFDQESRSTMARTIFNAAGHAATQNKEAAIGTARAQMDLDTKASEDNPDDDVLFQDKLNRVRDGARFVAGMHGYDADSPVAKDAEMNASSRIWAQRITGKARLAPFEAGQMLAEHGKEMTEADRLKVEQVVRSNSLATGSANIARQVYEDGRETDTKPGKTLQAMEDEARAKAKELMPNDPLLQQHVVTALHGIWNQDKYAERQEQITNRQIVAAGIERGVKNDQELRADPKVAAAIDALPASERNKIPARINSFNAARDRTANDDNFKRLLGLAESDPEQFMNTDVMSEKLSQGQMVQLHRLQQKVRENPGGDPRVGAAMNMIRGARPAELEALGIFRRTADNKDDYDRFVGALQQGLEVWRETHGRVPNYKEITETIAPDLMRQIATPGTVFGSWWPNKEPAFKQEVPEEWAKSATQQILAAGGQAPTQAQLERAYAREQFQKLYAKPPKADTSRVPQSQ